MSAQPSPDEHLGLRETTASSEPRPRAADEALLQGSFGRYTILRLLGRGGMGEVYLAHDTLLRRDVAIKVPRVIRASDTELVERFFREARTAAKLSHPNLCPVFDVGEIGGQLFLAMPYIPGESLATVLHRGPLPIRQAVEIAAVLAIAAAEAHRLGILHRDLKPGNVMLNQRGEPIVMDFGLARFQQAEDLQLTSTGAFLGTPAYAAPEQLLGDISSLNPACDIYSLGVILFEMLTGRTPFGGTMAAVIKQTLVDPPPAPSTLRSGIDPALDAICLRALAKQPADRFPSMDAFAAALKQLPKDGWEYEAELITSPTPDDAAEAVPKSASTVQLAGVTLHGSAPVAAALPKRTSWISWPTIIIAICGLGLLSCAGICAAISSAVPSFLERIENEMKADPNWDDLANFWRPSLTMPPDFNQVSVPGFTLVAQEEVEEIPGFELKLPSRHATFHSTKGDLNVYVAQASEFEKEAALRKVIAIVQQHDDDRPPSNSQSAERLPDYPNYSSRIRQGDSSGHFFSYRHYDHFGRPEDAAVVWWDEGWLFFARSQSEAEPRFFLRDLLAAIQGSKGE